MRIKLDENIPASLAQSLAALGHTVDTVRDEGLTGRPDSDIWAAAQTRKALFITQDMDFSDMRPYEPGSHAGLLLVRLHNPGRFAVRSRLESIFRTENVEGWKGCFVVVTERKIRIRRPPPRPQ